MMNRRADRLYLFMCLFIFAFDRRDQWAKGKKTKYNTKRRPQSINHPLRVSGRGLKVLRKTRIIDKLPLDRTNDYSQPIKRSLAGW